LSQYGISRYFLGILGLGLIVLGTGPIFNSGSAHGNAAKDYSSQNAKPPAQRPKFLREFSGPDDVTKGLPPAVEKSLTILFGPADPRTLVTNLEKPFAIATDSTHRVFVADPTAGGVHMFDFANYRYAFLGGPETNLRSPVGVAIDGDDQIYVRPFPGPGGKWQISTGGAVAALWSPNGRELFYESQDNRIMVVSYTAAGESFVPRKPRTWSEKQILYAGLLNLDIAPDGRRFAVFPIPEALGNREEPAHLTFLLNFFDDVRRRIPGGN
jgi:hypothetical protein